MYGQEHSHVRFVKYSILKELIQQETELFATSDTQVYHVDIIYGDKKREKKWYERRNKK
jgi:hypothetical protein